MFFQVSSFYIPKQSKADVGIDDLALALSVQPTGQYQNGQLFNKSTTSAPCKKLLLKFTSNYDFGVLHSKRLEEMIWTFYCVSFRKWTVVSFPGQLQNIELKNLPKGTDLRILWLPGFHHKQNQKVLDANVKLCSNDKTCRYFVLFSNSSGEAIKYILLRKVAAKLYLLHHYQQLLNVTMTFELSFRDIYFRPDRKVSWTEGKKWCDNMNARLPYFYSAQHLETFKSVLKLSYKMPPIEGIFLGVLSRKVLGVSSS